MLERSGDLALWASLTALETISQLRCPLSKKDRVRLRSRPFVTVMTKYGDASCDLESSTTPKLSYQYSIHFRGLRRYNRRPPVYFCTVPVRSGKLGPRSTAVRAQRLTSTQQPCSRCVPLAYQCVELAKRTMCERQIVRLLTCQQHQHCKRHFTAPSTVQHLQTKWRSRIFTSMAAA